MKKLRRINQDERNKRRRRSLVLATIAGVVLVVTLLIQNNYEEHERKLLLLDSGTSSSSAQSHSLTTQLLQKNNNIRPATTTDTKAKSELQQEQQQSTQLKEPVSQPPPPQTPIAAVAGIGTSSRSSSTSSSLQKQKEQQQKEEPAAAAAAAAAIAAAATTSAAAAQDTTTTTQTNSQKATKSLHPKWKLWHEMNKEQQDTAIREIAKYVQKYGHLIGRQHFKVQIPSTNLACELWNPGNGAHRLCGPAPAPSALGSPPCTFLSFGIDADASYDIEVAEEWGCHGFATDAKVIHPSKLHPLVTFHNIGLSNTNTLRQQQQSTTTTRILEQEQDEQEGISISWVSSIPSVRKFLKLDHQDRDIDIVKIDCQDGCEIALTRDILIEDIHFFHSITQIDIETHVTKTWIDSLEELYYFGLLFALLEEAGHVMVSSQVYGCNLKHEKAGCRPEFNEWGFPCGLGPNRKVSKSCHGFLFVKKEKAYKKNNG